MAINLQKGQRINLEKGNGTKLTHICVGVNWGAIETKGMFSTTKTAVDLDASCILYDSNKQIIETVYYGNLKSKDGAVKHSGDDLTGDLDGDDGLDNEVLTLDFSALNPAVQYVGFCLNSFKKQDFKDIPFASIRIYEGTPAQVREVFATYNVAKDSSFAGSIAMVLGVFYLRNGEWKFNAIGEPTKDSDLKSTQKTIQERFL